MNWMSTNSVWLRVVVFAASGAFGTLIASAAEMTKAWPSDADTRGLSGPAGAFAREIERLAAQSRREASDDQCRAGDLYTWFWRMSESERQDERMIQRLAELLRHDEQDETCLGPHILGVLWFIGPPARAALPLLKDRLEAEEAVMAEYRGEKRERIFQLLPERTLHYELEQTIARIEGADVSGRKNEGP